MALKAIPYNYATHYLHLLCGDGPQTSAILAPGTFEVIGIPTGYISSLEERLIETEIALFDALSFINIHFHQGGNTQVEPSQYHDAFTTHSTSLSKQAKVKEWRRLPLTSEDQQKAWLQEKLHVASRRDYQNDSIGESPESQGTEHPWPDSPPFAQHNEALLLPQRQSLVHSQNAQDNQGLIQAEYLPAIHGNESLQVSRNYTSATLETPERLPAVTTWANNSTQQRPGEEAQITSRERDGRVSITITWSAELNVQWVGSPLPRGKKGFFETVAKILLENNNITLSVTPEIKYP
ncbi:hypothetical protein V493_01185 [Pseudogymnoascus sp. VKM F-4281 (FW-2241)]|nr:hypothetical protein V493_01185 [Pseudogymnoascus sp. VKM F-4281 (FW-2241)]